jgi:hypothetical protein
MIERIVVWKATGNDAERIPAAKPRYNRISKRCASGRGSHISAAFEYLIGGPGNGELFV